VIGLLRHGLFVTAPDSLERKIMDKLIQEHRKRFGEFEVIEFVDEQKLAGLRDQLNLSVPVGLNWTWNYGSEVAELRNLVREGQGQPVERGDRPRLVGSGQQGRVHRQSRAVAARAGVQAPGKDEATQKAAAFDEINYLLSQLLHGEQAALQLCGQLTNVCTKMDEKWYAASQVIDEARHIEAISKFLQRKMGTIYPIGGTLKVLLDILCAPRARSRRRSACRRCSRAWPSASWTSCAARAARRSSEMLRRVEQDESRHAAFGVLMMRRVVREASTDEKERDGGLGVLDPRGAQRQSAARHAARARPKYEIDPEQITRAFLSIPEWATVNSIPFMHTVIPNLRNLGLITERTQADWRRVGMMVESAPGVKGVPVAAS
jgi:hypothetical protein